MIVMWIVLGKLLTPFAMERPALDAALADKGARVLAVKCPRLAVQTTQGACPEWAPNCLALYPSPHDVLAVDPLMCELVELEIKQTKPENVFVEKSPH